MSLFKRVWGSSGASADKKKGHKATPANMTIDSIEALDQKEQHLEKRRELMEKRIQEELDRARKYNSENKKSQAVMCLKKKKMYEKNMTDLGNLIMKVNEQKILLENAQTTAETLKAIEGATVASASVLKQNNIDNVDTLMDSIADSTSIMQEINERIAEPSAAVDLDEDALLEELEELEAERIDEELILPNAVPQHQDNLELPSVPATVPVAPKPVIAPTMTSEEKELEALAAELA